MCGPTRAENVSATRGASRSATESLSQTFLIFVAVPRAYSPNSMYIPMPLRQSDTRPSPSLPFSLFLPCQSASACTAAKRRHITRIHNNLHRRRTSRTKIKLPGRKVNTDRHSYLMASCYLEISVALCATPRYLYKNALPFPVGILGHCFQFKV